MTRARERLLEAVARSERGIALRLSRPVHGRAVLGADVVSLAHALGRVVALPEDAEQLVVARLCGVEDREDDLGVTGAAAASLLVGRVRGVTARIADRGRVDPGRLPEEPLQRSLQVSCVVAVAMTA